MELILVRHGRPEHIENSDRPADPPLTDTGQQQALAMAGWLATESIDGLYSSTMARAKETAAPLGRLIGMEPEVRHGVREFDSEDRSYTPSEVLRENPEAYRRFMLEEMAVDRTAFFAEVVETLTTIVADHTSQRVVVVCHGGVINAWAAHVLDLGSKMFFNPDYTSINRFMISSAGHQSIISLNERAHLRAAPGLQLQ